MDDGAPTTTDATGASFARRRSQPGTYRVRCAPGHGLSPASRRRSSCRERARASPSSAACACALAPASPSRARLRQHRAARGEAVVPDGRQRLVLLADAPDARPGEGRRDRLRDRRQRIPSSSAGSSPAQSFVGGSPYTDDAGPRHVRRRRDRREPVQPAGHRRPRVQRAAADREGGRRPTATVPLTAEVERDPLGGRQRRAGDQPQPRRRARPARLASSTRTRRSSRPPIELRLLRRARWSSPRSATGRSRRRRRGPTPTTRRRCRTCIGVSAVRQNGSVPAYSNRDAIYVDLAAPGDDDLLDRSRSNLVDDGPAAPTGRTPTAGPPSSATRSARRSRRRRSRPRPRSCSAQIRS